MWYDWMAGGWGGRNGRDGANCTSPIFGAGLAVQPLEGQERLSPIITSTHEIRADSGGPGQYRGGCGVEKGGVLTEAQGTVISYSCDRARSITWGIAGGLPSLPHGTWLQEKGSDRRFLGVIFSGVPISPGDHFTRPSAGGGGLGDPLDRDPQAVCEDVADGYVTVKRALRDYGVVVHRVDPELPEYAVDEEATLAAREEISRMRFAWLEDDPEAVAERYRGGEIDVLDAVRRYGVILDWGTGELLPRTTATFRAMMRRRSAAYWKPTYDPDPARGLL